jgi:hypothetical protein
MYKKMLIMLSVAFLAISFVSPGLIAQVTLVDEDFEGSYLPAGWTQINYSAEAGTHWWHQAAPGSNYQHGSYTACCWWASDPNYQDEWLITPSLDLTGYTAATLQFSSAYYGSASSCDQHDYIFVSTDGGQTWGNPLDDLAKNYGTGWTYINDYPNPMIYDLTTYVDQTILVGFNYYFMGGSGKGIWTIDDVLITAEEGGSGDTTDFDLVMLQIIRPNTIEEGGVAFTPGCRIENTADSVAHPMIHCRIKDLDDQLTVYEDVLNEYPLDPGINEVTGFKDFTPEGNVDYEVLFVLEHPDDTNEDNNDIDKRFEASVGVEITATDVLAPDSDQLNSFSPKAKFEEKAGAESTDANLHCIIEDNTYHAVVYDEAVNAQTFTALEIKDVEFPEATGLATGSYTISFWASDPVDVEIISHPVLVMTFDYTGVVEEPVVARFGLVASGNNVSFSLPNATTVNLKVYDIAGNVVADLASGSYGAGTHQVSFDANPGVYFVRMTTPEFSTTEKTTIFIK